MIVVLVEREREEREGRDVCVYHCVLASSQGPSKVSMLHAERNSENLREPVDKAVVQALGRV